MVKGLQFYTFFTLKTLGKTYKKTLKICTFSVQYRRMERVMNWYEGRFAGIRKGFAPE